MDCLGVDGTPLEKMMLMLNDKMDRMYETLQDLQHQLGADREWVRSTKAAIPWADIGSRTSITFYRSNSNVFCFFDDSGEWVFKDVEEWNRKGWNVWERFHDGRHAYYEAIVKGVLPDSPVRTVSVEHRLLTPGGGSVIFCQSPMSSDQQFL